MALHTWAYGDVLNATDLNGNFSLLNSLIGSGFVWRGAWDVATPYAVADVVSYGGSSWRAIDASTGVTPVEGAYWTLVSAKGDAGATGGQWFSGSGVPSDGTGANGDFYLRTNGDVYQKAAGTWGSPVSNILGPTGPAGPTGGVWYTGSGAPSDGTGADGDWYLRSNGLAYHKASGAWGSSVFSLLGPAGPTGATGPTGPAGADGATWHTGSGVPSDGMGADNDLYLRSSNGEIYLKVAGVWTDQSFSLIGPTGATGADGTIWFTGTAAPDDAVGVNGDFYFRSSGSHAIYHKAAGTWGSAICSLGVSEWTSVNLTGQANPLDERSSSFTTGTRSVQWTNATADWVVYLPGGAFLIQNSSGHNITFQAGPTPASTVVVADGARVFVYCDGTNIWRMDSAAPSGTGFQHVTAGVLDSGAQLVTNADVDAAAAIALSKLAITGTPTGSKFLRDDGSWQTAGGGSTPTGTGWVHVTGGVQDGAASTPTYTDVGAAAASHNHAAADINSGTIATARLGSGTANSTVFLRGDQTWAAPAGGSSDDRDAWLFG